MRLRSALLTGAVLALGATTLTTSADAVTKPKVWCEIVKDDAGDTRNTIYGFVDSPAMDILAVDVASGKNEVVAVLKLAGTNTANDNWNTVGGFSWSMGFSVSGEQYIFTVDRPPYHEPQTTSVTVGSTHPKYSFKVEGNKFVWRITRSQLKNLNRKKGQLFEGLHATSMAFGSSQDTAPSADDTTPTPKYPDKAPSCVKAK